MTPNFEKFFFPYLKCMSDGKEHQLGELAEYCASYLNLSEADREERTRQGGFTKFYDRTQWTGTYFRKALLIKTVKRGRYIITQRGKELWNSNITSMDKKTLDRYQEFREFAYGHKNEAEDLPQKSAASPQTPSDIMAEAHKQISDELVEELLDTIKKQSPQFFERLVVKLLVAMGYGGSFEDAASVTRYTHDEGIDGVIKEDKLGLDSIYIQAKRYDGSSVGRKEIQSFVGALSGKGATKGVFITTSTFTKDAKEYKPASNIKIVLIDGMALCNYLIEYNLGVTVRQTYEIKKIDSDFFSEE